MPELRASLAVLALATALPFAIVPSAVAAPEMVVAELGSLAGYPDYSVTGINDLGEVVGAAQGDDLPPHAVLWSPRGGATDLGPGLSVGVNERGQVLGLEIRAVSAPYSNKPWVWFNGTRTVVMRSDAAWATAPAINGNGAVPVNYSTSLMLQSHNRAAVWQAGRHAELALSGPELWVYGINDAGVVVGSYASFDTQEFAAVRCADGACTRLGGSPGYGMYIPEGITEAGVVVGNRGTVALRWEGDEATVLSENGRVAHGEEALNERGDAVGWAADKDGNRRAVLWPADGKQVDLGLPAPSEAVAINERGDVVGWTDAGDLPSPRAFLWRAGRITYLDPPNGHFSMPVAINNHGVVAGHTTGTDSTTRPTTWTPVRNDR
jgi:probable HAF family extracellular repeat protein